MRGDATHRGRPWSRSAAMSEILAGAGPGTRVLGPGFHRSVADLVRRLPRGTVTTYGDVAAALGSRRVARHVGFALAALPESTDVPWHRVLQSTGRVPSRTGSDRQRRRLEADGLQFDVRGRLVDFPRLRSRGAAALGGIPDGGP